MFVFCVGHIYSLTMLYNLNVRTKVLRSYVTNDLESIPLTVLEGTIMPATIKGQL